MSHTSAEHGAVTHKKALGTAQKGLTVGLEGWWGLLGVERPAVRFFRVVSSCTVFYTGMGHFFLILYINVAMHY